MYNKCVIGFCIFGQKNKDEKTIYSIDSNRSISRMHKASA